jgi:uncharacterized coiled-coil protein SlyX
MTEETENLVLEVLKRVQADIAVLRSEVSATRRDLGERMTRLEVRMTAQEQHLSTLVLSLPAAHERIDDLTRRVERIERRLELSE